MMEADAAPFDEVLISRRAVADHLGISPRGFVKMIDRGEGPPYFRFGRMQRFSPTAVKAWEASQVEIVATDQHTDQKYSPPHNRAA
jgi:predicted DNA-binding transcriptional regulator AlpA